MSAADDQAAAAYACDRDRREEDAVVHYDAAFALGGPSEDRAGFLLGYGSTLRNVGRLDQSLAILTAAVAEFPDDHALRCSLDAVLRLEAAAPTVARYARALREYMDILLAT